MKKLLLIVLFSGMLIPSSALAQSKAGIQPHPGHTAPPEKTCNASELLKARMHQAIYNAVKYPPNVAYSVYRGVTGIRYDYLNGHVINVTITASSGTGTLDRAAVRAVRDAKYPPVPAAFRDKVITDLVYIIFDNTGTLAARYGTPDTKDAINRQAAMDLRCTTKSKS